MVEMLHKLGFGGKEEDECDDTGADYWKFGGSFTLGGGSTRERSPLFGSIND